MKVAEFTTRKNLISFVFMFFTIIILFLMFAGNFFSTAGNLWFSTHQQNSDELVISRLLKTERHGVWSEAGMMGVYESAYSDPGKMVSLEKDLIKIAYILNPESLSSYNIYTSQIGFQGIVLSSIFPAINAISKYVIETYKAGHAYNNLPKRLTKNQLILWISSFITALLSAIILASVVNWFRLEFGLATGTIVLLSITFSPWIIVFGHSIYWQMGLWFLPMTIAMYALRQATISGPSIAGRIIITSAMAIFIMLATAIKCACGYEYISTILISTLVPVLYYGVKKSWSLFRQISYFVITGASGLAGFALTLVLHAYQLSYHFKTPLRDGFNIIMTRALTRTQIIHTDAIGKLINQIEPVDNISVIKIIYKYIFGFYGGLGVFIPFAILIILFLIVSCKLQYGNSSIKALCVSTWFSITAPLSWFILAKEHSYNHYHLNYVLWHLPFTLFGWAMVGLYLMENKEKLKEMIFIFVNWSDNEQ